MAVGPTFFWHYGDSDEDWFKHAASNIFQIFIFLQKGGWFCFNLFSVIAMAWACIVKRRQ